MQHNKYHCKESPELFFSEFWGCSPSQRCHKELPKSGRSPLSCQLSLLDFENTIFKIRKIRPKKIWHFFRHLKGLAF